MQSLFNCTAYPLMDYQSNIDKPQEFVISHSGPSDEEKSLVSSDEIGNIDLHKDEETDLLSLALALHEEGNHQAAFPLFKQLAKNDNPQALVELLYLYVNGTGIEQNYHKALNCYKRIAALEPTLLAENPNINLACLHDTLGCMYSLGGLGIDKNLSEAKKHFEMAVENKSVDAYGFLGALYQHSINFDVAKFMPANKVDHQIEKDDAKALGYHRLGLQHGDENSLSAIELIHQFSHNVERGYAEKVNWKENGRATTLAKQCTTTGDMFRVGHGVAIDYIKTRAWYQKALMLGDPTVMIKLIHTNHRIQELQQLG